VVIHAKLLLADPRAELYLDKFSLILYLAFEDDAFSIEIVSHMVARLELVVYRCG